MSEGISFENLNRTVAVRLTLVVFPSSVIYVDRLFLAFDRTDILKCALLLGLFSLQLDDFLRRLR